MDPCVRGIGSVAAEIATSGVVFEGFLTDSWKGKGRALEAVSLFL